MKSPLSSEIDLGAAADRTAQAAFQSLHPFSIQEHAQALLDLLGLDLEIKVRNGRHPGHLKIDVKVRQH